MKNTLSHIESITYRNVGRGRPTSDKAVRVRKAVVKAVMMNETAMSTKDIARSIKQSKSSVIVALRWAEKNGHINFGGWQKQEGVGHPMAVWMV